MGLSSKLKIQLLAYAVKDITNDQALVAYANIDERLAASPSI